MKHYIWLSLLLALGVVQAEDKPEEATTEAAPAEAAPAEEATATEAPAESAPAEEATVTEESASAGEDTSTEEKPKKSKRKDKKNRKSKSIKKGRKHQKNKKIKKKIKGSKKGGRNVQTTSGSVLNAYMNRVQSGEMYSTGSASSMSTMTSDQGGCATGNCGLPAPEAAVESAV